ncbi:hypothetical protein CDCA_CDCA06G1856 [Cyanidium caldarium]|uniref:Uncharacterized protein n=1 Tax=Cyanidium caldarium TaxID=2771 RepID=A0AAV9IUR3_CYACA|nr:hypothetical protein CDCA_CDCA06G1856 [Cyanidium caldarium]
MRCTAHRRIPSACHRRWSAEQQDVAAASLRSHDTVMPPVASLAMEHFPPETAPDPAAPPSLDACNASLPQHVVRLQQRHETGEQEVAQLEDERQRVEMQMRKLAEAYHAIIEAMHRKRKPGEHCSPQSRRGTR